MKRVAIFLALILLGIQVPGQVNEFGAPIIRNYITQLTHGSEQNWCITKDKMGNLYFGNQDRGVICYDGTKCPRFKLEIIQGFIHWNLIPEELYMLVQLLSLVTFNLMKKGEQNIFHLLHE